MIKFQEVPVSNFGHKISCCIWGF